MGRLFKLNYHFKDGTTWKSEDTDVALTAEQIAYLLNEQTKNDHMEIENVATRQTRKVSEIKSIEIRF